MTPSRTLNVLSLSWLFLACVSVAALALLIPVVSKMKWPTPAPGTVSTTALEVGGSVIHEGLPVGRQELLEAVQRNSPDREGLVLKAHRLGRLPTGPRIYNGDRTRYVQVVGIPEVSAQGDMSDNPACAFYSGACELVLGRHESNTSSASLLEESNVSVSALEPRYFLDERHVLLSSKVGDGPCEIATSAVLNVDTATITRGVAMHLCTEDAEQMPGAYRGHVFFVDMDRRNYPEIVISTRNSALEFMKVGDTLRYQIKQNEQVLAEALLPADNGQWPPRIEVDGAAYAQDPSRLRIVMGEKTFVFTVRDGVMSLVR